MPKPEVYDKNEPDLNNFFRPIKRKAHFKDSINSNTGDENRTFKANKSKGWTSYKNHHTIDILVEAVKKDIEFIKLSNLNDQIQTLIRVKERQLKNYPKRKILSLLTLIKEEPLPLQTRKIISKKLRPN